MCVTVYCLFFFLILGVSIDTCVDHNFAGI